jgi:hypothetical protein
MQPGYAEQPEANQSAFQPETGAPILRRRTSLSQDLVTFTSQLTSLQWEGVKYFYRYTIKDGTLQFTMNHPRTQTAATWAWVPGSPPKVNQTYGLTFEIVFTLRLISGGALLGPDLGAQSGVAIGWSPGNPIGIE